MRPLEDLDRLVISTEHPCGRRAQLEVFGRERSGLVRAREGFVGLEPGTSSGSRKGPGALVTGEQADEGFVGVRRPLRACARCAVYGQPYAGEDVARPRMASMKERMLRGELYLAADAELTRDRARCQALLEVYNQTRDRDHDERARLLDDLLGDVGKGVVIKPTFRCDYGYNISIGADTFVNYDCVMLDVVPIQIGSACQLATCVQLLAATHPIDPDARRLGWEYGKPITVGNNVWLGGGVIVCPGVTIGDDTVVGAGAVVTRDLPAGVVAAGNPARVQREVGERDRVTTPKS
jgi:maltose O-acetyltransferase